MNEITSARLVRLAGHPRLMGPDVFVTHRSQIGRRVRVNLFDVPTFLEATLRGR